MYLLSVIAFAVALSLDGFCVGISYGVRKIRIPPVSLLVISLTSSVVILISMLFGNIVARYISVKAAGIVGAIILICVGLWIIFKTWRSQRKKQKCAGQPVEAVQMPGPEQPPGAAEMSAGERQVLEIHLRPLGLVIHILKEPAEADLDKSGTICSYEAVLLGLALAVDSMGAGFGLAMAGFKSLLTPVFIAGMVGLASFVLVAAGRLLGCRYAGRWFGDRAGAIQGGVLIGLGLLRVFKM